MSETYILTEAVEIKTGGKVNFIGDIILQAPTGEIQGLFARLEAEYAKLQKIQADEAKETVKGMTPAEIAENVKAFAEIQAAQGEAEEVEDSKEEQIKEFFKQVKATGFDLNTSYSLLKEILLSHNGAVMVSDSGDYKMEKGHWNKLPMKEIKGLLGFYIINFIAGLD